MFCHFVLEGTRNEPSRSQRPRSFWLATGIMTSGQVQLRKSATHGLPVTLRMLRVKSDKSDWFWSQSIVFSKPFKTWISLGLARGPDFSGACQKGPLGTRLFNGKMTVLTKLIYQPVLSRTSKLTGDNGRWCTMGEQHKWRGHVFDISIGCFSYSARHKNNISIFVKASHTLVFDIWRTFWPWLVEIW